MSVRLLWALLPLAAACGSPSSPPDRGTDHAGGSGGGSSGAGGGATAGGSGGSALGGRAGTSGGGGKPAGGTSGAGAMGGSAGSSAGSGGTTGGSAGTMTALGGTGGSTAGAGASGGAPMGGQGGGALGGGSGMAGSGAAGSGAGGSGPMLHGGASGKYVCAAGAAYGNPLTGMGSVTTIGPPTMGQPNYFAFIEGPVWVQSLGKLFFSDNVSPERIWVLTPGGTPAVFQEKSNSNGLALDPNDQLVVTDQEQNRITRLDPTSSTPTQTLLGSAGCKPNDAIVRSDGNIYYTAPNGSGTGFWRMTPSGMTTGPRTDVGAPNGIELSPDENTLYVGDVNNKQITKFAVDAGGAVAATGTPFATTTGSTADGMCVDCAGNLYVSTANGVEVYSPDGKMLGSVPTGEASNCTFGGSDRKTIYVTSRSQLKAVTLAVPGLPD